MHLLIIEDSESDAGLILRYLAKAGYEVQHKRVETAPEMASALDDHQWDAIVSDYHMPSFSAPAALAVLQASQLDIPFVVVSGMMGEETAVDMMRLGAHDYVMKSNLARLPVALEREIREASNRKHRRLAEKGKHESETRLQSVLENIPVVFAEAELDGRYRLVNATAAAVFNTTPSELIGKKFSQFVSPETAEVFLQRVKEVQSTGQPMQVTDLLETEAGTLHFISMLFPFFDELGRVRSVGSIAQNITELRQAEQNLARQLEEKAKLVRELYHRTNNNMQVIQALLQYRLSVHPELSLEQFVDDVVGQISVMAQAQQELFRGQELSRIDLEKYLGSVVQLAQDRYTRSENPVSVHFLLEPVSVLLDSAVPLGLAVNELVASVLRQAHSNPQESGAPTEITVACSTTETGEIEVQVSDSGVQGGVDFDAGVKPEASVFGVNGLELAKALVEQQLGGTLAVTNDRGITCVLRFRDNHYEERV